MHKILWGLGGSDGRGSIFFIYTKFQNKEIKLNFRDLLPIHAGYIGIIAGDFYIKSWEVANIPNLRE